METIYKRRSIRKYLQGTVTKDQILSIIKAGMNAPSAGNEQPWVYVVIDDRKLLEAIPKIHPYSLMIKDAPLAILLCADMTREKHQGFWVQDCAAAAENMLLAITSEGLGSVWLGVYPRDDRVRGLRQLISMPAHIIPFALFPIGHPGEEKEPKNEFHPEKIHHNKWNAIYK